jgi:hypothetical protein
LLDLQADGVADDRQYAEPEHRDDYPQHSLQDVEQ